MPGEFELILLTFAEKLLKWPLSQAIMYLKTLLPYQYIYWVKIAPKLVATVIMHNPLPM